MKHIKKDSPEFRRVLKNLQLENIRLTPKLQDKVLNIINSGTPISPTLIKEAFYDGQI